MNVLSISSHVAYGHVGNSAAVFAPQRLGIEAWPVHTVGCSNHPGHGRHRGTVTSAPEIAGIVAGLDDIGVLAGCDTVPSGYLGKGATGAAVRDAVTLAKRRNPHAVYPCDPVMAIPATGKKGQPQRTQRTQRRFFAPCRPTQNGTTRVLEFQSRGYASL